MKFVNVLGMGVVALGLAACAQTGVTRGENPSAPVSAFASNDASAKRVADGKSPFSVRKVTVTVPRTLVVSEANRYLPPGDIVWRGDPIGDRYVQVENIVQDAMNRGVASLDGPVRVDLDVTIRKFHGLTEKARYSFGGVHAITFDLALKDTKTGELLLPVQSVRADLEAFGGEQAIAADAAGQTQKVRITDHLANVIQRELTDPNGYTNSRLGLIQSLNYQ
jgi:hypothetical protein